MAAVLYAPKSFETVHEWTGPLTSRNVCEAHRALYVQYIRTHYHYYFQTFSFWRNFYGGQHEINQWAGPHLSPTGSQCKKYDFWSQQKDEQETEK